MEFDCYSRYAQELNGFPCLLSPARHAALIPVPTDADDAGVVAVWRYMMRPFPVSVIVRLVKYIVE